MKLLLDTHLLLWAAVKPSRLAAVATELINDPENDLFFSAASIWEVAIKYALRRADFPVDAGTLNQGLIDNGYTELSVISAHGSAVAALPPIHKDPFDRLLLAQAIVAEIVFLTSDPIIAKYPGPVRLV